MRWRQRLRQSARCGGDVALRGERERRRRAPGSLACSAAVRSSASAASARVHYAALELGVLALEPVEARRESRLGAPKRREVVEVFDLMMAVQAAMSPCSRGAATTASCAGRRASRGVVVGRQLEPARSRGAGARAPRARTPRSLRGARATSRADGDRARTRAPRPAVARVVVRAQAARGARPETLPRDQAPDHDARSVRLKKTAAEPKSFAWPESSWCSAPTRSTTALDTGVQELDDQHEQAGADQQARARPRSGRATTPVGTSTTQSRTSWRNAASWRHAARSPANEKNVALTIRRSPVLPGLPMREPDAEGGRMVPGLRRRVDCGGGRRSLRARCAARAGRTETSRRARADRSVPSR